MFSIIFTSISLFYYTFKICINIKWCFMRFWYWLNSNILVSSEGIITISYNYIIIYNIIHYFNYITILYLSHYIIITKSFMFTFSLFMRFKFVFCSKGMKAIQTIKITMVFLILFLMIILIIFLLQDNASFWT